MERDPLDSFVTRLLQQKGIADDSATHNQLKQEVEEAIDQAFLEALPLTQLDKLEEKSNTGEVDATYIESLLDEVGVKSEDVARDALSKFEDRYLKGEK